MRRNPTSMGSLCMPVNNFSTITAEILARSLAYLNCQNPDRFSKIYGMFSVNYCFYASALLLTMSTIQTSSETHEF